MVTQAQLRQQMSRVQSPSSATYLRQQDISSRARRDATPTKSQAVLEEEYRQEIISKNVSGLESEKAKAQQKLQTLRTTLDAKMAQLNKEGKLTSSVMRSLNEEWISQRKYVIGDIRGYDTAITEAKKGAYTLESLKGYAGQVASYEEQRQAVQQRMQEIKREPKPQVTPTATTPTTKYATQSQRGGETRKTLTQTGAYDPFSYRIGDTPRQKTFQQAETFVPSTQPPPPSMSTMMDTPKTSGIIDSPTKVDIKPIVMGSISKQSLDLIRFDKKLSPVQQDLMDIGEKYQARINRQAEVYRDMGYTSSEATRLARESIRRKVSFTPEGAEKVIHPVKTYFKDVKAKVVESPVGQFVKFVGSPFGDEYTVIGGKLIKKEEVEKLPPEQQKLLFFAQPESILAMTSFPRIPETTGVTFYGTKTTSKGGEQFTSIKFKTTTGEGGEAFGQSKIISHLDDYSLGKADVLVKKGTRVIDLTKGGNIDLKDVQKFRVGEEFAIGYGDDIAVQVGAGDIVSPKTKFDVLTIRYGDDIITQIIPKDAIKFKSADIIKVSDDVATSFGKTITKEGDVISMGKIKDFSKISLADDASSIIGGGTKTSLSTTFTETVSETAVKSAVRGIVETPKISYGGYSRGMTGAIVQDIVTPTTPKVTTDTKISQKVTIPSLDLSQTSIPSSESIQDLSQTTIPSLVDTQKTKLSTKVVTLQSSDVVQLSPQKTRQVFSTDTLTEQVSILRQPQKLKQPQKQSRITPTIPSLPQIAPTPITPIPAKLGAAITQLKEKVKKGDGFEAIGFRFGKEVSLLKGTKKEVTKKLHTFLTKTLGASGFLKQAGRKLKAEETGLLGKAGFRKSKVDPFKIVEKKEKRLRKGTTGKEIQYFKKTKRKKKKKSLFGI